jgi:hypothetical protein
VQGNYPHSYLKSMVTNLICSQHLGVVLVTCYAFPFYKDKARFARALEKKNLICLFHVRKFLYLEKTVNRLQGR